MSKLGELNKIEREYTSEETAELSQKESGASMTHGEFYDKQAEFEAEIEAKAETRSGNAGGRPDGENTRAALSNMQDNSPLPQKDTEDPQVNQSEKEFGTAKSVGIDR